MFRLLGRSVGLSPFVRMESDLWQCTALLVDYVCLLSRN